MNFLQKLNEILLFQVTNQLRARFTPSPANIKKRIEGLIERDYLSRDQSDRYLYYFIILL